MANDDKAISESLHIFISFFFPISLRHSHMEIDTLAMFV